MPDIFILIAGQDDLGSSPGHVCLAHQDVANLHGFRNQRVIVEVNCPKSSCRHQFYLNDILHFGRMSENKQGWWVSLEKALKAA